MTAPERLDEYGVRQWRDGLQLDTDAVHVTASNGMVSVRTDRHLTPDEAKQAGNMLWRAGSYAEARPGRHRPPNTTTTGTKLVPRKRWWR